jgi:hypothetical protein
VVDCLLKFLPMPIQTEEHLLRSFLDSTASILVMSIDWLITPDIILCDM